MFPLTYLSYLEKQSLFYIGRITVNNVAAKNLQLELEQNCLAVSVSVDYDVDTP